jgi:hypothetical protein
VNNIMSIVKSSMQMLKSWNKSRHQVFHIMLVNEACEYPCSCLIDITIGCILYRLPIWSRVLYTH